MIRKGIILAGGHGTRMSPLTKAVNKQLLPIYDKPLIFYPLSILMLAKIKDILIVVNKGQLDQFKKIIPNGKNLGIKINYIEQNKPKGLPDAFILGKKFIGKENVAMILGDNFFYSQNLSNMLQKSTKLKNGAKILIHPVSKPELYGVAKINDKKRIVLIKEKPKKYISNYAITGLYFFDNKVVDYASKLKPSKRKELEIVDLLLNELQYLPSHPLWVCYDKRFMEAVKNHGYEILSLKFEPKHYVTIRIEGVIKNSAIYKDNFIAQMNRKGVHGGDILSVEENSKRLLRQLELGPTGLYIQRAKYNRLFNEMTENRTLLHYEELFCSDLPFPLQPERKEEWLNLVERSWCDYDENEYRKWIIPEDAYEGPAHRFLQTIHSLIENKKWGLWKDE